jgi:dolichyl-phosphate-mannose-protein mannosyltransferase
MIKTLTRKSVPWFAIAIAGIFFVSLTLRFWGLERFNTLVFDEIYYAKFGNDYLNRIPFFDAHPPLSKYIIAIGMWIGSHVPWWQGTVNGLTGSLRSPMSYRWLNALFGSFIPLIIAGIAYQLKGRGNPSSKSFAVIAGLFTACDGIFLVESRYALINIYIVIFGLLGQLCFLLALSNQKQRRIFWLVLSGLGFGASVGVKWNGLYFLGGIYLIWMSAWVIRWLQPNSSGNYEKPQKNQKIFTLGNKCRDFSQKLGNLPSLGVSTTIPNFYNNLTKPGINSPLQNLTQLNIFQMLFFLGIIPVVFYSLIWIPHLLIDTKWGFIAVHQKILEFHLQMGANSSKVHPYCAAWYTWPLMIRPMAYYYQTAASLSEPLPVLGPPVPANAGKVIYDVHAMGNPFLWWFGLAGLLFLAGMLVQQILIPWVKQRRFPLPETLSVDIWIAIYLVFNYAANLMPWVKVNRCVFIYHYMCPVVFAFLAIAWIVDWCIHSYYKEIRAVGVTTSFIIIGAFIFWMPIYLGLPLSPGAYRPLRMWFNSWI